MSDKTKDIDRESTTEQPNSTNAESQPVQFQDFAADLIENGVVTMTAAEDFLSSNRLILSLHLEKRDQRETIRSLVNETREVRVGDHSCTLHCDIDPYAPSEFGRIVVYNERPEDENTESIVQPTSLDNGIEKMVDYIGPTDSSSPSNRTISVESLTDKLFERFDNAVSVHVHHLPSATEVSQLIIKVHTGDADSFEEYVDLVPASDVTIDVGQSDPLKLPYDIMATMDGPGGMQGSEGTTIYMSETVNGAESRDLDNGLTRLQKKLGGNCPACGEAVDSLRDHHREQHPCREEERL
jgi:hypothetical protein